MDDYTRDAAVLTAFAESDFIVDAVQEAREGDGYSYGVFQQKPRWWPTARQGTAAQTGAFLDNFRRRTGDLVNDCWLVQRWAPSDHFDPKSKETQNYTERVTRARIIALTGQLSPKVI